MNLAVVMMVDLFTVTVGLIALGGCLWLRGRWLLASLAEEIRAPLATAQIDAELLLATCPEPATGERDAESLASDVHHLSGMVESFLRLAQPMAPADTCKHVPVHVDDLVLATARRCRLLASTRDVNGFFGSTSHCAIVILEKGRRQTASTRPAGIGANPS